MKKKETLLKIEVWVESDENLGIKWSLPHVTDDAMVEFYRKFMEQLCLQIAKVPGAEKLAGLFVLEEETEDG